jgi:hypothetical protein
MKSGRKAALALVFMSAAACEQPDRTVSYRVARVNGKSLPFTLREDGACKHWLLEGFIRMPGDGSYSSTFNIDIVCPDSTKDVHDPGIAGTVRSSGDTIYFIDSAGKSAGHGTINADSLVVQGPLHRLTYMRVRDGSGPAGN